MGDDSLGATKPVAQISDFQRLPGQKAGKDIQANIVTND